MEDTKMMYISYITSLVNNNPFRLLVSGYTEAARMRDKLNPKGRIQLIEAGRPKPYKPVLVIKGAKKAKPLRLRQWRVEVTIDYIKKVAMNLTVKATTAEEAAREAYRKALGDGPTAPAIATLYKGLIKVDYAFHADGHIEPLPGALSGSRVYEKMYAQRLGIIDLSTIIDKSYYCIRNILENRHTVDPFTMLEVAVALDCDLKDIAFRPGDGTPSGANLAVLKEHQVRRQAGVARCREHFDVKCDYCGKTISLRAFELGPKRHFCSVECAIRGASTHECRICGKRFKVKKDDDAKKKHTGPLSLKAQRMNRPGTIICALCEAEWGWVG